MDDPECPPEASANVLEPAGCPVLDVVVLPVFNPVCQQVWLAVGFATTVGATVLS